MKKILIVMLLLVCLKPLAFSQEVPTFTSERWKFLNSDYEFEEYLGKPSVMLKNNRVVLTQANFKNGTIEFDVAFPQSRAFIGVTFRMQDDQNYEEFYVRPHQSGNPDANQYCPVFTGVTSWQLYTGEGFSAPTNYVFNQWIHIKLAITDDRMDVFIEDMNKPAFHVSKLKRIPASGDVGLYSATGAAHFANFTYSISTPQLTHTSGEDVKKNVTKGIITQWHISNAFPEKILESTTQLSKEIMSQRTWAKAGTEASGLLNIASVTSWSQTNNTTFAKLIIQSQKEQIKKLTVGFSDRVKVFVNGKICFGAQDGFRSRDYRFLGTIGFFDDIYLPLKKGRNEILIAVSEDFGGWGIQAKIEDQQDITFE